jgi:hypothetical protein
VVRQPIAQRCAHLSGGLGIGGHFRGGGFLGGEILSSTWRGKGARNES